MSVIDPRPPTPPVAGAPRSSRDDHSLTRAARPFILWMGGAMVLSCIVIIWGVVNAFGPPMVLAVERWARGEHVDWAGFAILLSAIGTFLTVAWGIIAQVLSQRSRERRDEIAFYGQVQPPFASAPQSTPPLQGPSPTGGLVNNEAIDPR